MFLAMTSYKAFWDTDDELLFLGPWCTLYDRRHEWENLKHQLLPNPWNDRKRVENGITYCIRVSDHLTEELAAYLNAVHRVSHGVRYWRILLGVWLNYYVQDLYARYVQICDALDAVPNIRTLCLAPGSWKTPRDTEESVDFYFRTDRYPLQLYSHVLRMLGRVMPDRAAEFPDDPVGTISSTANKIDRVILKYFLRLAKLIQPQDVVFCDMKDMTFEHALTMLRESHYRVWPLLETFRDSTCSERDRSPRRTGLERLQARDEFERVVIASLVSNFPTIYLEGYERARAASVRGWNRPPKVLVTACGWACNDYFKFLAAECAERGSRLIGVQHGCMYGLARVASWEVLERSFTDRWYAWGWSELANDPKVRDLPYPSLSLLAKTSPDRQSDCILYTSTDFYISLNRMHNSPMENQYEEYFSWRLQFINSLTQQLAGRLLVRLSPKDLGWNQARRLRDADARVHLDDFSMKFEDRLRAARLAVFDHPGTTFLQGLAFNVPCVLFWKSSHWECRAAAIPYFDRLREAGILFDDPIAAARQVQRIYEDPVSWWQTKQVREAHETFANRFALTRQDWAKTWAHELMTETALVAQNESSSTLGNNVGGSG